MNQDNESPAQGQAETDNVKDLDGSPEAGSPSAARSPEVPTDRASNLYIEVLEEIARQYRNLRDWVNGEVDSKGYSTIVFRPHEIASMNSIIREYWIANRALSPAASAQPSPSLEGEK